MLRYIAINSYKYKKDILYEFSYLLNNKVLIKNNGHKQLVKTLKMLHDITFYKLYDDYVNQI